MIDLFTEAVNAGIEAKKPFVIANRVGLLQLIAEINMKGKMPDKDWLLVLLSKIPGKSCPLFAKGYEPPKRAPPVRAVVEVSNHDDFFTGLSKVSRKFSGVIILGGTGKFDSGLGPYLLPISLGSLHQNFPLLVPLFLLVLSVVDLGDLLVAERQGKAQAKQLQTRHPDVSEGEARAFTGSTGEESTGAQRDRRRNGQGKRDARKQPVLFCRFQDEIRAERVEWC